MSTFVGLTLFADQTQFYVAADEISSFMQRDKYHPGDGTVVTMKNGTQYVVRESVDLIAGRAS